MALKFTILATALALAFSNSATADSAQSTRLCRLAINGEIADVEKKLNKNDFKTHRGFGEYNNKLRSGAKFPSLRKMLSLLPEGSLVMDAGTGYAKALREIVINSEKQHLPRLNGVGVSFKKPTHLEEENGKLESDLANYSDRLTYVEGDYIENMVNGKLAPYKGQVAFLMEVYGPLAYTTHFVAVLNAYADMLKVGGQALIHFDEVFTDFVFKTRDGKSARLKLRDLKRMIPLMTGGRLVMKDSAVHVDDQGVSFHGRSVIWLEKVKDDASPATLIEALVNFRDGSPPVRVFEFESI